MVNSMRYAIVEGGTVANVVLSDPDYAVQQGWVACPEEAGPGWLYDGTTFSPNIEGEQVRLADRYRAQRDAMLISCDWTQLADVPLADERRAAWAQYRQALRDITSQPGFPWSIEWPVQPT